MNNDDICSLSPTGTRIKGFYVGPLGPLRHGPTPGAHTDYMGNPLLGSTLGSDPESLDQNQNAGCFCLRDLSGLRVTVGLFGSYGLLLLGTCVLLVGSVLQALFCTWNIIGMY